MYALKTERWGEREGFRRQGTAVPSSRASFGRVRACVVGFHLFSEDKEWIWVWACFGDCRRRVIGSQNGLLHRSRQERRGVGDSQNRLENEPWWMVRAKHYLWQPDLLCQRTAERDGEKDREWEVGMKSREIKGRGGGGGTKNNRGGKERGELTRWLQQKRSCYLTHKEELSIRSVVTAEITNLHWCGLEDDKQCANVKDLHCWAQNGTWKRRRDESCDELRRASAGWNTVFSCGGRIIQPLQQTAVCV